MESPAKPKGKALIGGDLLRIMLMQCIQKESKTVFWQFSVKFYMYTTGKSES